MVSCRSRSSMVRFAPSLHPKNRKDKAQNRGAERAASGDRRTPIQTFTISATCLNGKVSLRNSCRYKYQWDNFHTVLNKYYPPDFDPSKIPSRSAPKNVHQVVRLMAPSTL